MLVKLQESELISQLIENVTNKEGWQINGTEWIKLYENLSTATYEFLSIAKDKNRKTALVFTDASEAHNFLMGAIIEYHKNEDSDAVGGNWSFVYSFNPQDIVGAEMRYATDPQFLTVMNDISKNSMKDQFGVPCGFKLAAQDVSELFDYLIRYLIMWLDTNARANEVVDLLLEDHFKASVAIEEGIKVFAMVPHGRAKSKIKNDDAVAEDVQE